MDDSKLTKLLAADDGPIAAVLMSRGGWLSSPGGIDIAAYFPADETSTALWAITLKTEGDDPYNVVYTTADAILGVSIKRTHLNDFES